MVQNVTEACMVVKVPPSESWRTGVSSGAEKRKDNFGVRLRIEGACSLSVGREWPRTSAMGTAQGRREFLPLAGVAGSGVCQQLTEGKMMERRKKIALELSELVVYCRPVPFDEESKAPRGVHVCGSPPERVQGECFVP